MDYRELSSKVRAKYPGVYDDMDDQSLARSVVAKYPQYSDVTFDTPSPAGEPAPELSRAGTPPAGNLLQRLGTATRQMLLPKSMGEVKDMLNPNAGRYGVSKLLEEQGRKVGTAVRGAAMNTAEQMATSKFGQQNPNLAAGAGAVYSAAADVASDSLTPSGFQQQLGGEGFGIAGKAGLNAAATGAKTVAQNAGRRALGFIKSQLKKTRGGVERANVVAQEALDRGVITPLAQADDMLPRAQAVAKAGKGEAMDVIRVLDESKAVPDVDALNLAQKVKAQLEEVIGKGAPSADKTAIDEIVERVLSNADEKSGRFTFGSLQGLKEILQQPAKAKWLSQADNVKADLYRRASGIVNAELRRSIGTAGRNLPGRKELLDKYLAGNLSSGKGADMSRALADRVEREAGNQFVDPFTGAVALGGASYSLYEKDPKAAAATLAAVGLRKFGRSYGPQIAATAANAASKGAARASVNVGKTSPGFMALVQAAARRQLEEQKRRKK